MKNFTILVKILVVFVLFSNFSAAITKGISDGESISLKRQVRQVHVDMAGLTGVTGGILRIISGLLVFAGPFLLSAFGLPGIALAALTAALGFQQAQVQDQIHSDIIMAWGHHGPCQMTPNCKQTADIFF